MRLRPSRRAGRTHDVAVYAPEAACYYEANRDYMGGAEMQATMLAHALKAKGLRVAHVVHPIKGPARVDASTPTLVERPEWQTHRRLGELAEGRAVWRGLARADAKAYIVRGSGGYVIPAGAFCRVRNRRFVFSSSSELDFDFARTDRNPRLLQMYRKTLGLAARMVLQTERQRELALSEFPDGDPVVIPSFAEQVTPAKRAGDYFLWADRLVDYKLPECYVEMAEALPEARFLMIGSTVDETPPELPERMRAAAERLPNLELLPPRPRSELLEDMRGAVALVKTSRVEGMPNGFLEAWACGLPVLSLSVDPDSKIADNDIGVVAGGSMERLIEAADGLWRDPELRNAVGDRARRYVQDVHSPEAVAERWVALLQELI